jgi:hypothetical protein
MNTNVAKGHHLTKRSLDIGVGIISLLATAIVSGSGVYFWKNARLQELERQQSQQRNERPGTIILEATPSPLIREYREQVSQLTKENWERNHILRMTPSSSCPKRFPWLRPYKLSPTHCLPSHFPICQLRL